MIFTHNSKPLKIVIYSNIVFREFNISYFIFLDTTTARLLSLPVFKLTNHHIIIRLFFLHGPLPLFKLPVLFILNLNLFHLVLKHAQPSAQKTRVMLDLSKVVLGLFLAIGENVHLS